MKTSDQYFKQAMIFLGLFAIIDVYLSISSLLLNIEISKGVFVFFKLFLIFFISLYILGLKYFCLKRVKKASLDSWVTLLIIVIITRGPFIILILVHNIPISDQDNVFFLISIILESLMLIFSKKSLNALKKESTAINSKEKTQAVQDSFKMAQVFLGGYLLIILSVMLYFPLKGVQLLFGLMAFFLICWVCFWLLSKVEKGSFVAWSFLLLLAVLGIVLLIINNIFNEVFFLIFNFWEPLAFSIFMLAFAKKGLNRERKIKQKEQREKLKQELREELKVELKKEMQDKSNN